MPDGLPEGFAEGYWRSNLPEYVLAVGDDASGMTELPTDAMERWAKKTVHLGSRFPVPFRPAPLPEGEPVHERFTDCARRVMMLANQEAQRWNHPEIDVRHVLVALVKGGPTVAARALVHVRSRAGGNGLGRPEAGANQDFESDRTDLLRAVRLETEKLTGGGDDRPDVPAVLGRLPHSPLAADLVDRAVAAARRLNHDHVGPEHLLLGLIAQPPETVANRVLAALGVRLVDLETEVTRLLGPSGPKQEAPTFGGLSTPTTELPPHGAPWNAPCDPAKWLAHVTVSGDVGTDAADGTDDETAELLKGLDLFANPPSHLHVVRGRRYTDESLRLAVDAAYETLNRATNAGVADETIAAANAFLTDLFGGPAESGK